MNHRRSKSRGRIGLWLFCLLPLVGNSNLFAGDNAALISASVPASSPMMPGTMFTETWTLTNNGTTTWPAGESGYIFKLVGKDHLGAAPLYDDGSTTCLPPFTTINSGAAVPPGGQATFTMSFIAPQTAGAVTDVFQMCNAKGTNFGPQVSVQIFVETNGLPNQYDRAGAVSYANNFAGVVVSDGYFWVDGSSYQYFGAGAPVPTNFLGDDCAHFCSSCIGSQPGVGQKGGGLTVPSRVPPTYGEPGAQRLLYGVLVGGGLATEVDSLDQMSPGDLIGWNWEGDPSTGSIDHVTIYLGNGVLASHAVSALDVSADTFFQSGDSIAVRHLIHIYDAAAPTTTALSPINPATYGQTVFLTATVSPTPSSGTVQFYDNGVPLGSPLDATGGTVSFFTSFLSAGSNAITTTYSGSAEFQASSTASPSMLQINPAPLTITPNPCSKVYGTTLNIGGVTTGFSATGLQNNETIGSITIFDSNNGGAPTAPVGAYPITPSAATGGTFNTNNYDITYNPGVLTVTLPPNTTPVQIMGMVLTGGRCPQMNFTGTPGYVYQVQAATNLAPPVTWVTLASAAADSNGFFNFTDLTASNCATRFYRTSIHP